jgi:replicative DNA helicase
MAKAAIKAMADVITEQAISRELIETIKHKKAHGKHTTANLGKA